MHYLCESSWGCFLLLGAENLCVVLREGSEVGLEGKSRRKKDVQKASLLADQMEVEGG